MSDRLDAHEKPPKVLQDVYKFYQKVDVRRIPSTISSYIHCDGGAAKHEAAVIPARSIEIPSDIQHLLQDFEDTAPANTSTRLVDDREQVPQVFEVQGLPGLFIYPSLLPQQAQITLLEKLLHRDLSTFEHQTNVHLHHHIPELSKQNDESSASYFDRSSSKLEFVPKDPLVHKPFSTQQFLNKKLRWMTLGGQYDWTAKAYPSGPPPPFPPDIKHFVEGIFPMKAEAAIVNLYSPGNTLSLHRDVSEECDRPLVSISLGCEAIFVVGTTNGESDDQSEVAALRLKSGDAVLMSQGSRYAWHGVPRVLKDTCPEWLRAWPCEKNADHSSIYEHWRDWMSEKRVNINIRQMFE